MSNKNKKKIIVASDSHKEFASSLEVGKWIKRGLEEFIPSREIEVIPISDGGEGLIEALIKVYGGKIIKVKVKDPLFNEVEAQFGVIGKNREIAVIEMAQASGLFRLKKIERNPINTTTYGTGQLIKVALDMDCRRIIIGLGGAGTSDGGIGAAHALGVKFLDKGHREILETKDRGYTAKILPLIEGYDIQELDPRVKKTEFIIASDVKNPLLGSLGAAETYGPQKGASEREVRFLENGLKHYNQVLKRNLGRDFNIDGNGAAGGLGVSLMAFCEASLKLGIEVVLRFINFEEKLSNAQLVITGEGSLDKLTLNGKAPLGVAQVARKHGLPVIGIFGTVKGRVEDFSRFFDLIIDASQGEPTDIYKPGFHQVIGPERLVRAASQFASQFMAGSEFPNPP